MTVIVYHMESSIGFSHELDEIGNIDISTLLHINKFCTTTARKRSCGKVMFLHLSVILFTGGSLSRGVSVWGSLSRGSLSVGVSVQGLSRGVCVQGDPPVWWKSGRYASDWNAFSFQNALKSMRSLTPWSGEAS